MVETSTAHRSRVIGLQPTISHMKGLVRVNQPFLDRCWVVIPSQDARPVANEGLGWDHP